MTIELPDDLRGIVERAVANGRCPNEVEVVRTAIRLFGEMEDRRAALKRDIQQGIDSGGSIPAEVVFKELEALARGLASNGLSPQQ